MNCRLFSGIGKLSRKLQLNLRGLRAILSKWLLPTRGEGSGAEGSNGQRNQVAGSEVAGRDL
jgi:hypothetical protein